jgi:hypothetical protein
MNGATPETEPARPVSGWVLVLCGALAMSYGWGFRGDYGHEAGAMVPGALLGMAVCLCSGREDWYRRTALAGWLGAIGWAFGGQMSYGMITSYTISDSFPDVYYGYTCLFIVGAFWGGIGAGILSLAFTKSREELHASIGPALAIGIVWSVLGLLMWIPNHLQAIHDINVLKELTKLETEGTAAPLWLAVTGALAKGTYAYEIFTVRALHDVDWLAATTAIVVAGCYMVFSPKSRRACAFITLLAVGWWIGYLILVRGLDLHMQPKPGGTQRSDNWAGAIGLFIALAAHLLYTRNRAGLMLALYGLLGGGIGFAVGDFINKPDKIQWPPFYEIEFLRGFDHWKWTEQSFGFMMGAIVSLGMLRLLRRPIAPPEEHEADNARLSTDTFSLFGLLVVTFWWTFKLNARNVYTQGRITDMTMLGMKAPLWMFVLAMLYVALVLYLLHRHWREPMPLLPATALGRGQLLFLFFMWVTVLAVVTKRWPLENRGLLFVHGSFCVSAAICSWLVLTRPGSRPQRIDDGRTSEDAHWCLRPRHALIWPALWLLMPVLIAVMTAVTMSMHEGPGNGARLRFGPDAFHEQEPE